MRGRGSASFFEALARRDLEQIPACERFTRARNQLSVFARSVIARRYFAIQRARGIQDWLARELARAVLCDCKFVVDDAGQLTLVVDHEQAVGQIQHQVSLLRWSSKPRGQRLELEHEVVAKRAVEPE